MEFLSPLANLVTILDGIGKAFKFSRRALLRDTEIEDIRPESPLADDKPVVLNHASQVALRFRHVFDQITGCHRNFDIVSLAERLCLDSVDSLEMLMDGSAPASLSFLDQIANNIGVEPEWLKSGQGSPFQTEGPSVHNPRDYLQKIKIEEPSKVCFVRSNCETGYVLLLFQFDKIRFKAIRTVLHLSRKVGATGERQLFEFYEFIKEIRDEYRYGDRLNCSLSSYTLPPDDFENLSHGSVYPGAILREVWRDHWWDDLTDIEYKYPIARNRYAGYGKPFQEAQAKIRGLVAWMQRDTR